MANRRSSWIVFVSAILCIVGTAQADILHNNRPETYKPTGQIIQGACGPTTMTEGTSNTVTDGNSIACAQNGTLFTTDNSYWRAYNLVDFGITGNFDVCNVEVGIELAASGSGTGQPMTVNLYTSSQPFPAGFPGSLTLIGTMPTTVPDTSLSLFEIPVTGTAPANSQLVVEIHIPDGIAAMNQFFIGSNASAETAPSYLSAVSCGITTPTDLANVPPGFPNMNIVETVTGTEVTAFTAEPFSLTVDLLQAVGINGNGVLEMNEPLSTLVAPGWTNTGADPFTLTGVASNFTGPNVGLDVVYTLDDAAADYGLITAGSSGDCLVGGLGDCYGVTITGDRTLEPVHMDASMDEDVTPAVPPLFGQPHLFLKTWVLHVGESFTDVSNDLAVDPFYPSIETLLHNGVTAGCQDGTVYCPLQNVLRQEMAVFLLKSFLGSSYTPPACTPPGQFTDVLCPGQYTDFIEDLKTRNITAGCGDGTTYCPGADILRQEMAVFLLKTLLGGAYTPPACTPPGQFTDVLCPGQYTDWIEDLKTRSITAGCGDGTTFCPTATVTRQEMAAFLTITFSLVLYGP